MCQTFEVHGEERQQWLQYLKEQSLVIEVWNATTQSHFGTGRTRLVRMMRQGMPSKVCAAEIELFEPTLNQYVGTLQVMMTNEGRQTNQDKRARSIESRKETRTGSIERKTLAQPEQQKSKKVYSKPSNEKPVIMMPQVVAA